MPIVRVSGLPTHIPEDLLKSLEKGIINTVLQVEELKLKKDSDVTPLFPVDRRLIAENEAKIVIEVLGLLDKPERTHRIRIRLAHDLVAAVLALFPLAEFAECVIMLMDSERDVFYFRK